MDIDSSGVLITIATVIIIGYSFCVYICNRAAVHLSDGLSWHAAILDGRRGSLLPWSGVRWHGAGMLRFDAQGTAVSFSLHGSLGSLEKIRKKTTIMYVYAKTRTLIFHIEPNWNKHAFNFLWKTIITLNSSNSQCSANISLRGGYRCGRMSRSSNVT